MRSRFMRLGWARIGPRSTPYVEQSVPRNPLFRDDGWAQDGPTPNEGEDHEPQNPREDRRCPVRGARCVDPYVPRTLLGNDRMTRHLHIAEHWLRMNFWKWLPALTAVGVVLACLAHMNDPKSAFMASSAIRG